MTGLKMSEKTANVNPPQKKHQTRETRRERKPEATLKNNNNLG